jgi:tripeptide aminopeptidase
MNLSCASLVEPLIQETIAVQQIPAPTFKEKQRALYVKDRFTAQGYADVFMDHQNNVYGRIKGGDGPPLVVSAHLDTVFGLETDLTVTRAENRICGPGIGDNSLGVATLVMMGRILNCLGTRPRGDIILAANAAEEGLGDLTGMKAVFDHTITENPLAYIVLEGTSGSRTIYTRGIGSKRYKITASGLGGHSWNDFGSSSAIHGLSRLAAELTRLKTVKTPKTTFNIGIISGGVSVNTIAQEAFLLLDLRSETAEGLSNLISQMTAMTDRFSMPDIRIDRTIIGDRPSGSIPDDCALAVLCRDVFIETGFSSPLFKSGSTDANIPLSRNMPAVCIGMADGEDIHKTTESLLLDNLDRSVEKVGKIVSRAFDLPGSCS